MEKSSAKTQITSVIIYDGLTVNSLLRLMGALETARVSYIIYTSQQPNREEKTDACTYTVCTYANNYQKEQLTPTMEKNNQTSGYWSTFDVTGLPEEAIREYADTVLKTLMARSAGDGHSTKNQESLMQLNHR